MNIVINEDATRQKILQAAKQLFKAHGLYKVTMDDVAKAIGKGRSSLYYYYKSKDEIFDAVVQIDIREMIANIARAVDQANGVEDQLNAFCTAKLDSLRERRTFYNTLDAGMDADAMSNFNKIKVVHHDLIIKQESAILEQILTNGIKNGELEPKTPKELELLIFVLAASLHGIKREMLLSPDFDQFKPAVDTLTRMVMHGLKR